MNKHMHSLHINSGKPILRNILQLRFSYLVLTRHMPFEVEFYTAKSNTLCLPHGLAVVCILIIILHYPFPMSHSENETLFAVHQFKRIDFHYQV